MPYAGKKAALMDPYLNGKISELDSDFVEQLKSLVNVLLEIKKIFW